MLMFREIVNSTLTFLWMPDISWRATGPELGSIQLLLQIIF